MEYKEYIDSFMKSELIEKDEIVSYEEKINRLFNHCFINNAYNDSQHKADWEQYPYAMMVIDNNYTVKEFKYKDGEKGDGDRCEIVKKIYELLWEDFYSKCKEKKFSVEGETLNTRDTICAKNNWKLIKQKYYDIIPIAESFRLKYKTLGNFMPVVEGTTNTPRGGTSILGDQFDIYLMLVKLYYDDSKRKIENIKLSGEGEPIKTLNSDIEKIFEKSLEYFNCFDNFEKFIEANFLQDYVKDSAVLPLFAIDNEPIPKLSNKLEIQNYIKRRIRPYDSRYKYNTDPKYICTPENKKQILEYFIEATKRIDLRAERMKKELLKKLK